MKYLLTTLAVLITTTAHAQIYRCEINGETIYSQQPCATDAETVELRYHRVDPQSAAAAASSAADLKASNDAMTRERRIREIGNEIGRLESRNRRLLQSRDREIGQLRARQRTANNNLAGATYRQSIAEEMSAVNQRYDTQIRVNQEQIGRMRDDQRTLRGE